MFKGLVKDSVLVYAGAKMVKRSKKNAVVTSGFFSDSFKARVILRVAELELKALEKTRELEAKAEARKTKVTK